MTVVILALITFAILVLLVLLVRTMISAVKHRRSGIGPLKFERSNSPVLFWVVLGMRLLALLAITGVLYQSLGLEF